MAFCILHRLGVPGARASNARLGGARSTAIELSIETPGVDLPLPARNERGEGWGEGKSNKNTTPLPGPLLLLRRRRGRRAQSIPLIQRQCSLAPLRREREFVWQCRPSCDLISKWSGPTALAKIPPAFPP